LSRQALRLPNVPVLRALVAAAEQDDDLRAALDVVEPLARPEGDPSLHHAFADRLHIAEQAGLHAKDARNDDRPSLAVPQAIEPVVELFGGPCVCYK
jgi:hypothetical protein